MERISAKVNDRKLVVGDDAPCRVPAGIQFAPDLEPCRGRGGADEVHHHFMAHQRLAAPVLTDGGEQAMFDLVPFAVPGWEVAYLSHRPWDYA